MKIFILIIYIIVILVLPQLYTWAIRSAFDNSQDTLDSVIVGGGVIVIIILALFTGALFAWDILNFIV